METLHDILWNINNEYLAFRLRLLGVKPATPKKADMIDSLKQAFAGDGLQKVWFSLSALEQSAVAEACYAVGQRHDEIRFLAKYGSLASFYKLPKGESRSYSYWDSKYATKLNLFLFSMKHSTGRVIPVDLAKRLKEFVRAPAALTVTVLDEPRPEEGLNVRLTEHEALSEVIALLRLSEQGNLSISEKTAMPSAVGCRKMLPCFTEGDYFPPEVAYVKNKKTYQQEIGPIKAVGWSRLLKNGRYIGAKSKLTPAGIKALSRPTHEVIDHLWTKWVSNTTYDEFNRINDIKGQKSKGHMTAKPSRRDVIIDALSECPLNEWVELSSFSKYMQAQGHEFEVSSRTEKLYLGDRDYGSFGYNGYGEWSVVQFRYILSFFFEYAAPLGLIDIAYVHPKNALDDYRDQWGADDLEWLSRYDGLRAFRITSLGAYCLGMTSEFVQTQPASLLKVEVLSDLTIQIISGDPQPAETFLLDTWAEPVAHNAWRLNSIRACEAVERGQSTADFSAFLNQCGEQALPESVEEFFQSCESDGQALKGLGAAQIFECRDEGTADMISEQKELAKLCFRIGERKLAVPGAHVVKFRRVVKSLALGIV